MRKYRPPDYIFMKYLIKALFVVADLLNLY